MSRQRFKYYLHDDSDSAGRRETIESQGVQLSERAWEKLGRPFYEVALDCEVTEDGNVRILGIAQRG